jgi:hypothetical protein
MSDTALVEDYNNWKKYRMSIYDSNSDKPLIVQPDPTSFFVSDYPFLLSAEAKKRLLMGESLILQQMAQQQAMVEGRSTGFAVPFFVMLIEREHLLQTALQQIMSASDNDLRYYYYTCIDIHIQFF